MRPVLLEPLPELRAYVSKLWIAESINGLSPGTNLIAPNGRPKIMLPYKNNLSTTSRGKTAVCQENDIWFIGIRDTYAIIPGSMSELTNTAFSFSDLFGGEGKQLRDRLTEMQEPEHKALALQKFLLRRLQTESRINMVVNTSVQAILATDGLIPIQDLQTKTGYSRRYLNMLFQEHLGISPKTLGTIARFQKFYRLLQDDRTPHDGLIYDAYYDQSHFIREFKRFTGMAPGRLARLRNEFGRYF
ncbi:MAG: AraC family transcriptional regulator [Leptospirales bacterium]|nr:AraC family transcriptional regulator [Leptospirales bacterium]